jgi:hypothetical protein
MIQLMQNQGRIVMESDCGNDVVNFDDFVRVFAHFRPPKKNPDKNLMNTRDDKLRCKNTFVLGRVGASGSKKLEFLLPRKSIFFSINNLGSIFKLLNSIGSLFIFHVVANTYHCVNCNHYLSK